MLDTRLQERFTRRCTDAAFGYSAATTAAYAAFADQVFDFWAGVLEPERRETPAPQMAWGWPMAMPVTAPPPRRAATPVPFFPFPWAVPEQSRSAPADAAFAVAQAAFSAWLGMFSYAVPSPAWPMACMMMASGVPRSGAVPTAQANLAVMDAAEAASSSMHQALASYRGDSGHAVVRQQWPTPSPMMLAMLVPLNVSAMLSAARVS
jgi:hypothetical protein